MQSTLHVTENIRDNIRLAPYTLSCIIGRPRRLAEKDVELRKIERLHRFYDEQQPPLIRRAMLQVLR